MILIHILYISRTYHPFFSYIDVSVCIATTGCVFCLILGDFIELISRIKEDILLRDQMRE